MKRWWLIVPGLAGIVLVGVLGMLSEIDGSDHQDKGLEIVLSLDTSPRVVATESFSQAADSVLAVQYKFTDPELLDSLLSLVERGIRLRLLLDAGEASKSKSLWRPLAREGAEVRFWPSWDLGELHAKFVILDGRYVLTGSSNWTRGGSEKNVEVVIRVEEPSSVAAFQSIFDRLWAEGNRVPGREK